MLALKKKREAEKKAAAAAAAAAEAEGKTVEEPKGTEKVSLLGIGGKKKTKSGESTGTKKRTPGELRIQKGVCFCLVWDFRVLFTCHPDFSSSGSTFCTFLREKKKT